MNPTAKSNQSTVSEPLDGDDGTHYESLESTSEWWMAEFRNYESLNGYCTPKDRSRVVSDYIGVDETSEDKCFPLCNLKLDCYGFHW